MQQYKNLQSELDNLIENLSQNFETNDITNNSEAFLEVINSSPYLITLHDVDLYRPVCLNNNFRDFYGFKNNWLAGMDYMYYIKTIHVSTLNTLVKSVAFFKQKNDGYLNLKYQLLHHTNSYKKVIGSTKLLISEGNKPKYALTVAKQITHHKTIEQVHTLVNTLTTKEKEIARALLHGKTKKQIALELSISEHTVHTHTKKIYKKLNINKIQELIVLLENFPF